MTSTDELLTIEQAAATLNKPVRTLRNWRYRGGGPRSFRVGGSIRYSRHELDKWLDAQDAATGAGGDA